MWKLKDNLWGPLLSFYLVVSRDWTQVPRCGSNAFTGKTSHSPPPPLLFWDGPGICYASNNYFGLLIFLSLPPECCDHMCAPGAHLCDLETLICDFLHGRKTAHELTCKPKPLVRNFESVSFSFMGHMGWLINIFGSVGLLGIRVQDPVFPYLACRHANVPCILGNPCVSEPHLLLPH